MAASGRRYAPPLMPSVDMTSEIKPKMKIPVNASKAGQQTFPVALPITLT